MLGSVLEFWGPLFMDTPTCWGDLSSYSHYLFEVFQQGQRLQFQSALCLGYGTLPVQGFLQIKGSGLGVLTYRTGTLRSTFRHMKAVTAPVPAARLVGVGQV